MRQRTRREFLKAASLLALCSDPLSSTAAALTDRADTGQERAANPPNILLFFPDQLRFDWISGNSHNIPVRTPNLDGLARRGVRFQQAIVPSPLCAPSRACLASGKEYDRCRVPSNVVDYPLTERTLYSLLGDHEYFVAGCGKIDLHKATHDWGLDGKRDLKQWGFSDGIDNAGKGDAVGSGMKAPHDPYMAYLYGRHLAAIYIEDMLKRSGGKNPGGGSHRSYAATWPTPLPEDAYCDNWVASNGLGLMKTFPRGKPWYLAVNFVGPHAPLDITRRMELLVRHRHFPQPNGCRIFSPEIHELVRQNYTAMVENIDRWVGIYIDKLRERNELESTLIVFSSDHGEMLGDHNRWAKAAPYQPSVGVPLIVAGPGVKPGVVSEAPVTTMDLTATFLDYAGVRRPDDMDSRSLRPVLEGKTRTQREFVLCGLGPWRMVFDGRYKLIRGFDPHRESIWRSREEQLRYKRPQDGPALLFDLENDPWENSNIAQAAPDEVRRLSRVLSPIEAEVRSRS